MAEWFENLVNKDYLQDNLTFASLFIALYENMTDYVVSSVRDFLYWHKRRQNVLRGNRRVSQGDSETCGE